MKMIIKQQHRKISFDYLLFFCIMCSLFSPMMAYQYSTVFGTAMMLLWILFTLIYRKKWNVCEIIAVYFYCYVVIVPYITGYGFVGNRYMALGTFILACLIGNGCDKTSGWDSIGFVLKTSVPFLAFVYIKTFQALLESPWNARYIKNHDDYTIMLRMRGVGGYEFIYFLAMLVSISTGMFLLVKNLKKKVFFLLLSILSFVMIVMSNYMTALLIATVGCILTIAMFLIKRNNAWIIFFIFGMLLIVFFGNGLISALLDIAIKFLPHNGKTYMRLYSMKDSFFQELASHFLTDRSFTILDSIACVLEYPLLGIVGKIGLNRAELLQNVGQHSYFFDTFAFYGGFVGVLSIVNYFSTFKKIFLKEKLCIITIPLLASGILLLVFNNVTPSVGLALGIVYPYAIYLLKQQTEV